MQTVTVYTTQGRQPRFEPFEHGGMKIVFGDLDEEGPTVLAEGEVRAFVDWVLSDCSGLELCRRLRADPRTRHAHITMVLAVDDVEDRRRALAAGADDYIVGPAGRTAIIDRVIARGTAAIRPERSNIVIGPLDMDLRRVEARWNDTLLDLRPSEFRLLRFFVENADRALTRHQLLTGLGKQEPPIDERTVDVWVGRLRKALTAAGAPTALRTVRSVGYVFDTPTADPENTAL